MPLFKQGDVTVRTSVLEDILVLRNILRPEDCNEIWAAEHSTPERSLLICYLSSSVCHTVLLKEQPIAMFGLIPWSKHQANIWFLGSSDIEKVGKSFLKGCRIFIKGMLEMFPVLVNYVDARYEKSIRWLKWCGAEVGIAEPYGEDGLPFHRLTFRRG